MEIILENNHLFWSKSTLSYDKETKIYQFSVEAPIVQSADSFKIDNENQTLKRNEWANLIFNSNNFLSNPESQIKTFSLKNENQEKALQALLWFHREGLTPISGKEIVRVVYGENSKNARLGDIFEKEHSIYKSGFLIFKGRKYTLALPNFNDSHFIPAMNTNEHSNVLFSPHEFYTDIRPDENFTHITHFGEKINITSSSQRAALEFLLEQFQVSCNRTFYGGIWVRHQDILKYVTGEEYLKGERERELRIYKIFPSNHSIWRTGLLINSRSKALTI